MENEKNARQEAETRATEAAEQRQAVEQEVVVAAQAAKQAVLVKNDAKQTEEEITPDLATIGNHGSEVLVKKDAKEAPTEVAADTVEEEVEYQKAVAALEKKLAGDQIISRHMDRYRQTDNYR